MQPLPGGGGLTLVQHLLARVISTRALDTPGLPRKRSYFDPELALRKCLAADFADDLGKLGTPFEEPFRMFRDGVEVEFKITSSKSCLDGADASGLSTAGAERETEDALLQTAAPGPDRREPRSLFLCHREGILWAGAGRHEERRLGLYTVRGREAIPTATGAQRAMALAGRRIYLWHHKRAAFPPSCALYRGRVSSLLGPRTTPSQQRPLRFRSCQVRSD
ncbi:hypothetical protein N658DRAFT_75911 [Parathielavia hyrcaniae]|uniref:Uncharacterized protein n=1 Tax=Parathielavia hyrcaniae TaxID=113614 RepID=A0AAN6Q3C6_9PEZI|nr:hypothetical protein N658DRAFT_75911 [Parathielavia hyrcaniae]